MNLKAIRLNVWIMLTSAAASGILVGTHFDDTLAGVGGAVAGAGIARIVTLIFTDD